MIVWETASLGSVAGGVAAPGGSRFGCVAGRCLGVVAEHARDDRGGRLGGRADGWRMFGRWPGAGRACEGARFRDEVEACAGHLLEVTGALSVKLGHRA